MPQSRHKRLTAVTAGRSPACAAIARRIGPVAIAQIGASMPTTQNTESGRAKLRPAPRPAPVRTWARPSTGTRAAHARLVPYPRPAPGACGLWVGGLRLGQAQGDNHMIRLSTLVFVLCLSGNVASAKVEDMDRKRYGNCSVHIKNDGKDLTDVLGIAIYCYDDGGDRINASLLLYCWSERYLTSRQSPPFEKALVVLYAGTEFYLEETQLVKYRFDSGEIQSGEWIYTYSVARNYTAITFNEFAAGLRTAVRYADHASAAGNLSSLCSWWNDLCHSGPSFGYHANASKT